MFHRYLPLWLIAFLTLLPAAAHAQFDAATMLGRVTDQSGAAVPGATVTLTNLSTGIQAIAITNETGAYQFLNVRVGTYRIEAELAGFSTAVAPEVNVTVNARQRVDLSLQVGGIGEKVEVTAGVRTSSISSSRDASFNVNGMRSALNNFILDGVDNNSYGTSNQGFSNQVVQVTPDAVEEFKVQTNNFSAEFGRAGGAVINATFRSGTNQFHGTAWEFNRNTALNATGYFRPTTGKPTLNRNQFGGVFGGPLVRNRAFFFANYEGFRQVQRTVTFSSVPTAAQRQGIMGKPVMNPLTGEVYADGVIPQSAITPFAAKVLAGLPAPTRAGVSNNYDTLPRRQDYNDKFDIKLDQQVREGTNAFVRFSHRKVNNFEPPSLPGDTGSPSNAYVEVLNQQLALGVTRTLSTRSLLELRLGVSRTEAGKTALGTGSADMLHAYGISGLPTGTVFAGGLTQQSVSGWTAWGRQSSNPQFQNPLVVNARLNYSWIAGTHSLKSGYEYQSINTEVDDVHPKYGADSYSGGFSRPAASHRCCHLQSRRLPDGRAQQLRAGQPVRLQPAAAHALRLPARRLARVAEADDERRTPLRICDAAVGGRQLPDQLRPGDPHPVAGQGWFDCRPRARQPRSQQLRPARRGSRPSRASVRRRRATRPA